MSTRKRRYTVRHIADEINVSSSGDYFARIFLTDHDVRVTRDYWINGGSFLALTAQWGDWTPPKYLANEVRKCLGELMQAGKVRYFEYDRDRNKRYADYRYHDADYALMLAQRLIEEKL